MKAIKSNKKPGNKQMVTVVEDDDDDAQETAAVPQETLSGAEIVAEIGDDTIQPTLAPRSSATAIPTSVADAESLEIIFLEEVFDYPIIGQFNFQTQFGITKIKKHQKFVVPRHVAMVLYDKRLVSIPGLE